MAENKKVKTLTGLGAQATKLAFSTDGKSLVALTGDGTSIRVFDLGRGATRCQINPNNGEVGSLALSPDGKMLATTVKDSSVLFLWTTSGRVLAHKGSSIELSANELAKLWTDLADPNYEMADNAWRKLGAAGDFAVPMLREKIRAIAVPAVDLKKIEKLVAELDDEKFAIREKAQKELITSGELAIVPLQRMLENPPSAEASDRGRLILKRFAITPLTTEHQRVLDAVELLEQLKTPAAIGLLQEIEREALIPQIRTSARQALQRQKSN